MLSQVTPVLITYNEQPNIERTLARLHWAHEIIVVDSDSVDRTRELVRADARTRLFERPFTTHAEQWEYALTQTGVRTEWVLALDADYVLTDAFIDELSRLQPAADVAGYSASFIYCIEGTPLRSGTYPPVTVLYRRAAATYEVDGHAQRVRIQGRVLPMSAPIHHDDRKSLNHWLGAQIRYMRLEADKLHSTPAAELSWIDRVRSLIFIAPPAMFVYCLIIKGGVLDGLPGLYYALQRSTAEAMLSLNLLERMLPSHAARSAKNS